jgi:uncharacterized protein (TIGR02453 family)
MKEMFSFLKDLSKHNHKEFMDDNRLRYQGLRAEFLGMTGDLLESLAKVDPTLRAVPITKCLFRINRDTRFSANKQPYKTCFSAFLARGGTKGQWPGYYVHIEPGNASMIAAGVYMPAAPQLLAIRRHIGGHQAQLKALLAKPKFRSTWGALDTENTLRTAPRGFAPDHPAIGLLKLKSFTVHRVLKDKDLRSADFLAQIRDDFVLAAPLNGFLAAALGQTGRLTALH